MSIYSRQSKTTSYNVFKALFSAKSLSKENPVSGTDELPTKESLELNNVNNTSDVNKPVSTPQQQVLNNKMAVDLTIIDKSGNFTVIQSMNNNEIRQTSNSSSTITIPADSSQTITVGFQCIIKQHGSGQITFTGEAGVTVDSFSAYTKTAGQFAFVTLIKETANHWSISGNLTA